MQMLCRGCRLESPGADAKKCAKCWAGHVGWRKGIILTWRLERKWYFIRRTGCSRPRGFSDVPNFTALYCWTSAEI